MEQERTETAHLAIGDEVHGFLLESIDVLEDYHGYGYFYRHRLSGMEVYHVANDDRENFFAFMFKTPPDDDCGTPHIIEHSILAGSKRYPVRDPFMSLLKGSVNTFMNAMTYPDYTVYPAASVLPKDYKNLFAVYADAVFNPLLAEKTFWQEGIRTVAHEDGSLSFDGVVFNEMLGDLSDHDSIVARLSTRSLFPDTPYFYESGGDPSAIISLSYSQFLGYYSTYYHPSNCRLLLYGNQNAADQLQLLEQLYVQDAYRKSGSGATAMAKAWNTPRTITATSLAQEQTHNDATVAVSWATTLAEDPLEVLSLSVITDILLGNPGAPLYKAIIDSNLATDISQVSGMDANFKQMPFVVGAKGVDPKNSAEFSDLVFATLKELVEKGIPLPLIRNAIRRQEFAQQEISSDVPMGLRAMNRAARSWLQGKKPHTSISVSSVLSKLKALVEETVPQEGELLAQGGASKGPEGYLEQWITTNLLNNPHRILLIVKPDPSHNKRLENAIEQRLEQLRQQLGDKGLALLKEQHQQFVAFENSEDSEQDLATIPRLSKEDLPQSIRVLKQDFEHVDNVGLYLQPMESNGIIYLDGFFSVAALGGQQQLLLPLFVRLLHMCNVADMGYEEVAVRIRERTGGLYFFLETSSALNNEQKPTVAIGFRLKALQSDARQALDLLSQILSEADLSDTKRIKVVIQDLISDYISNVGSAANMFASQRASAQFSPILAQNEQWNGIDQWLFLQEIDLEDQNVLTEVGKQLQQMKTEVFQKRNLVLHLCAPQELLIETKPFVQQFVQSMPAGQNVADSFLVPAALRKQEVFAIPSSVSYSALVCQAAKPHEPLQAYQSLLAYLLTTNHLWTLIRGMGGAYGASAHVDMLEQLYVCSSYRDPRISSTLRDFEKALQQVADQGVSEELLEAAIISFVGKEMRPLAPKDAAMLAFRRALYGIDDAFRLKRRQWMLQATPEDIAKAAQALLVSLQQKAIVVVFSGQEPLEKEKLGQSLLTEQPRKLPF